MTLLQSKNSKDATKHSKGQKDNSIQMHFSVLVYQIGRKSDMDIKLKIDSIT
jgi:hypothetical protein